MVWGDDNDVVIMEICVAHYEVSREFLSILSSPQ